MARTERLLGEEFRKIQPKLRLFARANDDVNTIRSDFASAIRMKAEPAGVADTQLVRESQDVEADELKMPHMKKTSSGVEAAVFVSRVTPGPSGELDPSCDGVSTDGALATATVQMDQLGALAEDSDIAYIELGEALRAPDVILADPSATQPEPGERFFTRRKIGPVLVGIIDVGGFDFSHPDFADTKNGGTRWERIWDQGGGLRPAPAGRTYGSEIRKEHMNAAIDASERGEPSLPAWALEEQSQMSLGSHATHVASIAAGNLGVCRTAYLAGVLISLPEEESSDRRRSFYDSTRLAHAVDYLFEAAEEIRIAEGLDVLPVSINISLGTNGGGHDASNAVSRWIDSALTIPGRSVCVAAGNAGQEKAEAPDDFGFINGRIHTSGQIQARGLNTDIEWVVVGDGIADVSENELEIWYSGSDRFSVTITPPGLDPIGPINPQEFIQNQLLADGSVFSAYNELYQAANGENYIAIYLSPFMNEDHFVGVRPGTWKVRLHGLEVRDGHYHGWIERDDPRRRGVRADREQWNFPSFFTSSSNVDNSSVSSLACGQRVVAVANHDAHHDRINISSSQGPTRDGRFKPDVAAAGTAVVAANGFGGIDDPNWVAKTGTSMASPHVAGVVGLMLGVAPKLTAAQVCGIIQRTSNPLPNRNFEWANDSGYGVVDEVACLEEASGLEQRTKLNP